MPTKKKIKTGAVIAQMPKSPDGGVADANMQATTNMGVPLAPDQLFEVNEHLYASMQDLQNQIKGLQDLIGSKAHAAALALGANPKSHIVLSDDMRYIAVYHIASIEAANKDAQKQAAAKIPVTEEPVTDEV